jgi:hypothetical protein
MNSVEQIVEFIAANPSFTLVMDNDCAYFSDPADPDKFCGDIGDLWLLNCAFAQIAGIKIERC